MQCDKCGTALKDNKIVVQWSKAIEDEAKTFVFCPQCYEKEAINGIKYIHRRQSYDTSITRIRLDDMEGHMD